MEKFIVIDVGNRDVVVAFIKNFKIYKENRIETKIIKQNKNLKFLINLLFSSFKKEVFQSKKINSF